MASNEVNALSHCPYCNHGHQLASSMSNPEARPKPGDISICVECCNVLVFNDDLTTRKPTPLELDNALKNAEVVKLRKIMQYERRKLN